MRDVAQDSAALERLRVQRSRLADRMRPPWWWWSGVATLWALAFACPVGSRFLPQGYRIWPILAAGVAVALLLQSGLARATGITVASPMSRHPSGRPAATAMIVVSVAALVTEAVLIDRRLIAATIVVAGLAVVAEIAAQQAQLRGIRQDLRAGGGAA
ncbi:MAG TPA: hypothetical protein VGI58_11635 [Streptosporangiaceae bacterium]|jgi:hypothetical protein